MYKIGVDIGGTKINVGVFSGGGALLACQKLKIADIADIAEAVSGAAAELEEKLGAARDEMDFCGIGIPGTVSADGRRVVKAPNIGILHGNIAEELEERLGVRTALVQDSRAAAWGEYLFGAGKNKESVVCITLGTGIGCGIVLNGRIWNGSLGSAGELGHLPAVPNGRRCGCGKFGCVEKYAAGGGLDITAEELLGKGSTAKELFAAAEAGDESCKKALANAVMLLGNTVVAVINLLLNRNSVGRFKADSFVIEIGCNTNIGNIVNRRAFKPHALPNSALSSIPNAASVRFLLTTGIMIFLGQITHGNI